MVRVRRVKYETIIRGEPSTKWIEGDVRAWEEDAHNVIFRGRQTIRIPRNRILDDVEYERTFLTQLQEFLGG